ncbi:MAG: SCP-2 sterol transfer family protein [Gammaproteobacteria bacterium]|nr:SCP-2 sterol transfer family protein [Gammaproteobacteria bacterium]
MSDLFNNEWMKKFQSVWNNDPELAPALKKIHFNSIIGYGFTNEETPRGCITIEDGKVIDAGPYEGQSLNWDLRARENHWQEWLNREVSKAGFGLAYSTGKLKFLTGDFKGMIKNPSMARPFVKSISAMGRV